MNSPGNANLPIGPNQSGEAAPDLPAAPLPKASAIKKAMDQLNRRRNDALQPRISYRDIAQAVTTETGQKCSKSTVAQVLNGTYSSDNEAAYRSAIYQVLRGLGMPRLTVVSWSAKRTAEGEGPNPIQLVDLTGFVRYNRRDYYCGGLAGKFVRVEPGSEPNTIRIVHPMETGDLRPLDRSTTQLDPAPSTGRRRWSEPGEPGGPGKPLGNNPAKFRRELRQRPIRGGAALELLCIVPILSSILFGILYLPLPALVALFILWLLASYRRQVALCLSAALHLCGKFYQALADRR